MSSKRKRNKSPTTTPSDTTCTDPVKCEWDTCMQQFSCITDLVQHIEKTHIIKGIIKKYVCLWRNCLRNGKPYTERYMLVHHLRIHSGERPNICPYQGCNKAFIKLEYLKEHMQRHIGEKPYICQIQGCSKSFPTNKDRYRHQKKHSKQKPFACTFLGCDKKYTEQSALIKHAKKHKQRKKPSIEMSDKLEPSIKTSDKLEPSVKTLDKLEPSIKTSDKLEPSVKTSDKLEPSVKTSDKLEPSIKTSDKFEPSIETSDKFEPSIETSDKFDDCLPIPDLQNYRKAPNKRDHQLSKVEEQATPLIAATLEQHVHTDNGYLQLPFPEFMITLPDINTIFDDQDHANYSPDNLYYTDLQSQSYSLYHLPQMTDLSQHTYYPNGLLMPSQSSMTLSTNVHSHPQSTYKQYIPGHLPPYEDTQYMNYESPLTSTQQPIMSHLEDYFAIPTSSMFN